MSTFYANSSKSIVVGLSDNSTSIFSSKHSKSLKWNNIKTATNASTTNQSTASTISSSSSSSSSTSSSNSCTTPATLVQDQKTNNGKFLISAKDLAEQLTLIDLPTLKAISLAEIVSIGNVNAARSQNLQKSPNLIKMNKQFNQVSFYVINQILMQSSVKIRCEVICYFINVAHELLKLKNLHSCYAIVSAIQSSPIYRLEQTWHCMNKKFIKDKQQFDDLLNLLADSNNYQRLRKFVDEATLPCIPYIGLYLRDMIYINEAYGKDHSSLLQLNTQKIVDLIAKCQQSVYTSLTLRQEIQDHLSSCRYIDELQKMVEDENYRRSRELEPASSAST